jgi:hypothetical protein
MHGPYNIKFVLHMFGQKLGEFCCDWRLTSLRFMQVKFRYVLAVNKTCENNEQQDAKNNAEL